MIADLEWCTLHQCRVDSKLLMFYKMVKLMGSGPHDHLTLHTTIQDIYIPNPYTGVPTLGEQAVHPISNIALSLELSNIRTIPPPHSPKIWPQLQLLSLSRGASVSYMYIPRTVLRSLAVKSITLTQRVRCFLVHVDVITSSNSS